MPPTSASPRPIRITNTLTGKRELLETKTPGKLTMYSCGPTVYNFIHIGNLRTALVSDLFFRYFRRSGYEVTYVRNYTDVDDKIIKRAQEEGIPPDELARKYTVEVERDYASAGMLEPTHKTTVTTHIQEIISLTEKIIASGKGYVVEGEVFFSISDFPTYGKLSHKPLEDLIAGIRVQVGEKKRNPLDFSLWKPAKPGEPSWDSPWGKGRPGWHIECSAMASRWLGDEIDIHHGGEDLIFPHHENEIAQSEAASGHSPFVRYWVHNAFLNMAKEKMSKSLGNIITARQFLGQYSLELARYLMLSVHYRSPIDFGDEAIDHALTSLQRLYEAKARAANMNGTGEPGAVWKPFTDSCAQASREIDECFASDFNTAGALGAVFTQVREFNRIVADPAAAQAQGSGTAGRALIALMERDLGEVMGVGRLEPQAGLEELRKMRALRAQAAGGAGRITEAEIQGLIQARVDARKAKDFGKADQIRKELDARGVVIKDGPAGTTWEYK